MANQLLSSTRERPLVTDLIAHARDYPAFRVYSWERHGEFFSLYEGEEGEPPYDATEIFVRLVNFPGCALREIYLDARSRTHHHKAYEDILFYQVSGRRVQIVNERSREVNAGDASIQIAGVYKRVDQIIPGIFLEFSIQRPDKPGAEAQWIAADEAPLTDVPGADRCQRRTFHLQGYQLHDLRLAAGGALPETSDTVDTIFYVAEGELEVRIGDVSDAVGAGAGLRAPAGAAFSLKANSDVKVIYAPIPLERPDWP
jgi:mannose-6-phosphate isomerase-like protein (cupin superfamily)